MKTHDFDYTLPPKQIASEPLKNREAARLMIVDRATSQLSHHHIGDLAQYFTANDVLVFNETKVFPARLLGTLEEKPVELLLHRPIDDRTWECLAKPGRKFQDGTRLHWEEVHATVVKVQPDGSRWLEFSKRGEALHAWIDQHGTTPLPPYLKDSRATAEDYQTVYAKHRGSVAAPTAGLHFTETLLKRLEQKGVHQTFVTLHVGRGTFEPVKVEDLKDHVMHTEWFEVSLETAHTLNQLKAQEKRIIAIGTTSARTLESAARHGVLQSGSGETNLFITPGYRFQFVDALLTNFHLPKSTLLMLVSALTGTALMKEAYAEALRENYRFFSFGDAMLIV